MSRELDSIGLSYITLKDAFSNLIRRSKEELSICSPFADYEGLQPFKQEFLRAMKRKVRTRLLTRIASSRGQRLKLRGLGRFIDEMDEPLRSNFEIRSYHYSDETGLLSGIHAKLVISDRDACYVGSGEFRTYSFEKNLEVGVVMYGGPARALAGLFDYLYSRSQPLSIWEE